MSPDDSLVAAGASCPAREFRRACKSEIIRFKIRHDRLG